MSDSMKNACQKPVAHRRPFDTTEDAVIMRAMLAGPFEPWDAIAKRLPGRTARQCRERWANYLSPAIRSDPWTEEEDRMLIEKVNVLYFAWSAIAHAFNGRSDNDIKNRWYSHLKYETVYDGTKYIWIGSGVNSPYPQRKKRNRMRICPKQNAISLLEQQCACTSCQTPQTITPKPAPENVVNKPEVDDIWDRMIIEEGTEELPFF
jgi:hypothetical protein